MNRIQGMMLVLGLLAAGQARAQIMTASNNFYVAYVLNEKQLDGVGVYTIQTGLNHPAGPFRDIFYGGGSPFSSFNTVRSYTTGTDYTQTPYEPFSDNTLVTLDDYGTVTPLGTNGIRTTYVLPGPDAAVSPTPDQLTIIQDLIIHGSTFADSFVELTTRTINNGTQPAAIGVRYLWDYQIGNDDGPEFQPLTPDGSVLTHEATFSAPSFTDYVMADNDVNPNPPTLRIVGTVNGPGFISPTPTAPDLLQYACWGNSSGYAFDYLVDSNIDIATVNSNCQSGNDTGDCAVLYFFGADAPHAMTIAPGQTNTVSASLFARSPATRITGLSRAGTDSILNFLTISNAHYEVQTTTDLVNSVWSTIAPNVIGTGGIVTNIHSSGATNSKRFYRVGSQF